MSTPASLSLSLLRTASPSPSRTRSLGSLAALAAAVLMTACASTPPPQPAPATPALEQLLADAAKARQEGAHAKERETYHAAAKAYPASKEPWQRLSESYFQAGDYGHAILAAQEVAQRDPADELATGVLAVSGLRVSTSALAALRQQQRLSTDTRAHAEDVVKSLRDLLGEPVLVPKPAEQAPPPATPARKTARPAAKPAAATTAAPAAAPAAAAAKPATAAATTPAAPTATPAKPAATPAAPAAPAAKASPFDKLK